MDDFLDMTPDQKRWWNRLRRVLRDMPKDVELNARVGEIGISPAGSRNENFLKHGDADDFWEDEWDSFQVYRLDGRDNQI